LDLKTFKRKFDRHLGQPAMEKDSLYIFDEPDMASLKEALKRTYKERFEMATRLYKAGKTMDKATIVHKPVISK
jgi:hypothetical protein